ncbi:LysM peptidoglycan-binding domain-containing protein [Psittacicella hinzii]|uniref:N-acetylmuramoyl-L-alanine amidase n=1 Tax=Psittacicella hinzii TaxID=2028575 RepID=A0A3A1YNG8_9GAMM|nr:LysM peptidoglycan-binding domain-containing protein [Psittacicella hinzii]RIY38779.1 hypothetical protein CKF58_03445 [Psittacicella hinzii]
MKFAYCLFSTFARLWQIISIILLSCFSAPLALAATIDSISNIAKTHDQEAWLISYTGRQTHTPVLSYDSQKSLLTLKFTNDSLGSNIKYPLRIANSVFNRIDYSVQGRTTTINFYLNSPANAQIIKDGHAWKLVVAYTATVNIPPIIVAIDAGHGGKDPGTIGLVYRLYEKNVTFDIAKRLYALLESDPNFTPRLVRTKDTYIPVPDRSEIARKHKANLLISIHADASPNTSALGASVWVLSTTRATTETGRLLERQEQQSSLLGGTGEVLSNNSKIARDVIDLSFTQQQQVSTLLAQSILNQMANITNLHKRSPQYASLGVLKSPDIPSILIETGFLSNRVEEGRLNTTTYRQNIAQAIYNGLVNFRSNNLSMYISHAKIAEVVVREDRTSSSRLANVKSDTNAPTQVVGTKPYTVVKGDTLYGLADKFGVAYSQIVQVNDFKGETIYVGQKIKIPVVQSAALPEVANNVDYNKTTSYKIKAGDTLTKIAYAHQLTLEDLLKANPNVDRSKPIYVGMNLNIPSAHVAADNDDDYESVTRLVDSGVTHKVQKGENITLIAKRYSIDLDDLAAFNAVNPHKIFAGQVLRIPQIVVVKQKVTSDSKISSTTTPTKAPTNSGKNTGTNKPVSTQTPVTKTATQPAKTAQSSKTTQEASKASANSQRQVTTYTVQNGDSLTSIARKFKMTIKELKELNNIKRDVVYKGEKLKVYALTNSRRR